MNASLSFWQWFTRHGDDVFFFLTLVSAEAGREGIFPPSVMRYVVFAGAVAAIAHKVFFPNAQGPTVPKANP